MNIDINSSRLLSTVAIWTATALIFILGMCRMNFSGTAVGAWILISGLLALAPALATAAIWNPKLPGKPDQTNPEVNREPKA